jgi:lipooligosaccharide transport system permease protein
MNDLFPNLRLSWQVVVRNWTVYRKDFLANISPTLADPALILASLGMGLSGFVGQIDGMSYAQFLAPGMIATTALFTAFFESSYGFYVRMTFESVFKAMLTTPIGVNEVVTGEFMWVFVRAALMGLGVAVVLLLLGLLPNPLALLICPLIAGFLALPCAAIGLLASAWVRNINQFQTVYSFLIAPIFYLSGVFFPIPAGSVLGPIVQFSPFYHGVKLIQFTVWGHGGWNAVLWHAGLLGFFTVLLCGLSYRFIGRKLTT